MCYPTLESLLALGYKPIATVGKSQYLARRAALEEDAINYFLVHDGEAVNPFPAYMDRTTLMLLNQMFERLDKEG